MQRFRPKLAGVPETMLWTLYGRAHEALRPGGQLNDPEAVRILNGLDYDFRGRFGAPRGEVGLRAAAFDEVVRSFVAVQYAPVVISLGEGLETQRYRVPGDRLWVTLDLPSSVDVRERFIAPDDGHWHIRASATDSRALDIVPAGHPTLVVAQGLLMYLRPAQVRDLVVRIAGRFPGARLVFDYIPRMASWATRLGLPLSPRYRLPRMPFGVDRREVPRILDTWVPGTTVREQALPFTWSPIRLAYGAMSQIPGFRGRLPGIVVVDLPRG